MSVHHLIGASGYSPACAVLPGIANAAGSGDEPVVVTISNLVDQFGTGLLPANYAVAVSPSQACAVSISSKTTSGFDLDHAIEAGRSEHQVIHVQFWLMARSRSRRKCADLFVLF